MWVKSEGISAEGGSAYGRHHGDTEARSRGCVNPEARCALGIHATIDIWRRKRDQDKGDVKWAQKSSGSVIRNSSPSPLKTVLSNLRFPDLWQALSMWDLEISDLITPLLRFFPLCLRVSVVKILVCRAADRSACGGKKTLGICWYKKDQGRKGQ